MRTVNSYLPWLLLVLLLALPGCGAGVIGGALFGGSGSETQAPATSISVDVNTGPLVDSELFRILTVSNTESLQDPIVEFVWIGGPGGADPTDLQKVEFVEQVSGGFRVAFSMRTANIRAAVNQISSETEMDVDVQLRVSRTLGDGSTRQVVAELPFRLWRKVTLITVPGSGSNHIVVPASGGEIRCLVKGLPDLSLEGVTAHVATLDPLHGTSLIFSTATILSISDQGGREAILEATVPPLTFPNQAVLVISSGRIGQSAPIPIYYRQEIQSVVSPRGAADGGEIISLNGNAMVPYDFSSVPPVLDFDEVEILFHKDNRTTVISSDAVFPTLSSPTNIVLRTPPSPDGKPGPVTIELRVRLKGFSGLFPTVTTADLNSNVFAYGASAVSFDPRGVGLRESPVSTVVGNFRRLWSSQQGSDAASLYSDVSGMPFVQAYEGMDNGMFSRVGTPERSGDRLNQTQRNPVDLAAGDFNGDDRGDLFVLNRGQVTKSHTWLRGVENQSNTFELAGFAVASKPSVIPDLAVAGDWNAAGGTDLFLIGRDLGAGQASAKAFAEAVISDPLGFSKVGPGGEVTVSGSMTGVLVADLDGDGFSDLAMAGASGGSLVVAYGDGLGGFVDKRLEALPGLVASGSEVIGIHACGLGAVRDIALIVADQNAAPLSFPVVIVPSSGPRKYDTLAAVGVVTTTFHPTHTLSADLDGDSVDELVVGKLVVGVADSASVAVFEWKSGTFVERTHSISGLGSTHRIYDLHAGTCLVDDVVTPALVVVHEALVSPSLAEARMTSFIADSNGFLRHPMAEVALSATVEALETGDLGGGQEDELVLGYADTIQILESDSVGGWSVLNVLAVPKLLGRTVHVNPRVKNSISTGRVVYLTEEGRVGVFNVGDSTMVTSTQVVSEYRGHSIQPDPLVVPLEGSQFRVADVDGDGVQDLVILYVFETKRGGVASSVILARGGAVGVGEFPFSMPDPKLPVAVIDGTASSIALGDFAPDGQSRWLEAAVAVDTSNNGRPGVHFFRYQINPVGGGELVASIFSSSEPQLASSLNPRLLQAVDFEGDGRDDLVIVSDTFDAMYLLRQDSLSVRPANPGVVDPQAFGISAEVSLSPGEPIGLLVADLDRDQIFDFAVHVRTSSPTRNYVSVHISNGVGGIAGSSAVPEFRLVDPVTGSTHGKILHLGLSDTNRDSIPDLILGWDEAAGGTGAVLQSLFGSYR